MSLLSSRVLFCKHISNLLKVSKGLGHTLDVHILGLLSSRCLAIIGIDVQVEYMRALEDRQDLNSPRRCPKKHQKTNK